MTDENPTPTEPPASATTPTTTTPSVVTAERGTNSWVRPVAAVAVLVATLLVGGIGGFVLANAVDGPRGPIGALMDRPTRDDRPDLRQDPRPAPGHERPDRPGPGPQHPEEESPESTDTDSTQ